MLATIRQITSCLAAFSDSNWRSANACVSRVNKIRSWVERRDDSPLALLGQVLEGFRRRLLRGFLLRALLQGLQRRLQQRAPHSCAGRALQPWQLAQDLRSSSTVLQKVLVLTSYMRLRSSHRIWPLARVMTKCLSCLDTGNACFHPHSSSACCDLNVYPEHSQLLACKAGGSRSTDSTLCSDHGESMRRLCMLQGDPCGCEARPLWRPQR